MCLAIEESQENFAVGFSWKTDGSIPTGHSAYHVWHSLADRRVEFELRPFNDAEISMALNRFSRELGERLSSQLERVLRDHCQGYPWLLKKLCVHILDLVRSGMPQAEIIGRALSIEDLFKRDVQTLNERELSCITKIATETPAEYFRIADWFGDDVVRTLLDKRLIIMSGQRLSLYWDIFRDYVLTDRVPYIPVSYIPQAHFPKFTRGLRFLLTHQMATYVDMALQLGISKGGVDNLVRDYVALGLVDADRPHERVRLVVKSEKDASVKILDFCRFHVLYRALATELGVGRAFSEDIVIRLMQEKYRDARFSDKTWQLYAVKMMGWFVGSGLAEQQGRVWLLRTETPLLTIPGEQQLQRGPRFGHFLGEAPPEKVFSLVTALARGPMELGEAERRFGRNAIIVARKFKLATIEAHSVTAMPHARQDPEGALRTAAGSSAPMAFVCSFSTSNISGATVGKRVAQEFAYRWSEASQARTGNALRRWAEWLRGDKQHRLALVGTAGLETGTR